ncbi:hypothetical protein B0A50_00800 [Salinomyces thailandicus]|uniref:Uncharacterized protein n=1 Tax=Salinomyces thailandicus TaxID=706561 RepID=A0A4U0UDA2_9PEZI|nr:hypothetical protein B0A50_00800 [Salinomyces thailandica]
MDSSKQSSPSPTQANSKSTDSHTPTKTPPSNRPRSNTIGSGQDNNNNNNNKSPSQTQKPTPIKQPKPKYWTYASTIPPHDFPHHARSPRPPQNSPTSPPRPTTVNMEDPETTSLISSSPQRKGVVPTSSASSSEGEGEAGSGSSSSYSEVSASEARSMPTSRRPSRQLDAEYRVIEQPFPGPGDEVEGCGEDGD